MGWGGGGFLQIVDIHVGNFNWKVVSPDSRWGQWESIPNIHVYITKFVVLVSEPVRGRSRATELPCYSTNNIRLGYE